MKETCVLLVVDLQTALLEGHPHHGVETLEQVQSLIKHCRTQGIEVIYIRHDGGNGDELEYGVLGWEICPQIAPLPSEKNFDKRVNSAFRDTGLCPYLDERGVKTLILVGMQTEYCIDATCKSAFERHFNVIIPEGCFTTYSNNWLSGEELNVFYTDIWHERFASVLPLQQVVEML